MAQTDVEIETPDGGAFSGKLPEYAMEATQKKMLAAMVKQWKLDEKQFNSAEKLLEESRKGTAASLENASAIENLSDAIEKQMSGGGLFGKVLSGSRAAVGFAADAFLTVGAGVTAFGAGLAYATLEATKYSMELGEQLNSLNERGIGFQAGLVNATSDLRQFGMTTQEVVALLEQAGTAVSLLGAQEIANVNREFQAITQGGKSLGMTMQQSAEYLAEELENRAELGILRDIDSRKQSEAAERVIQAQLLATQFLGKSIKDITASVQDLLKSNVQVNAILNKDLGAANDDLRMMFSDLSGLGVSQEIQNALGDMLGGISLADTDQARELLVSLEALGGQGQDAVAAIKQFRSAMQAGDPEGMERALALVGRELPEAMAQASKMNQEQALAIGRSVGIFNEFIVSGRLVNQAMKTREKLEKSMTAEDRLRVEAAQELQLQVNNTMGSVFGALGSISTQVQGMIGEFLLPYFRGLGDITDENSVLGQTMTLLRESAISVIQALKQALGIGEVGNEVKVDLSGLQEKIRSTTQAIVGWIQGFTADSGSETVLERMGDMAGKALDQLFSDVIKPRFDAMLESIRDTLVGGFKSLIADLVMALGALIALKNAPALMATDMLTKKAGGAGQAAGAASKAGKLGKMGKLAGKAGILGVGMAALDTYLEVGEIDTEQDKIRARMKEVQAKLSDKSKLTQNQILALETENAELLASMDEQARAKVESMGSGVGGAIGATIGAALGSVVPGIGTMIGGTIGYGIGQWAGGFADNIAGMFTTAMEDKSHAELESEEQEVADKLTEMRAKLDDFKKSKRRSIFGNERAAKWLEEDIAELEAQETQIKSLLGKKQETIATPEENVQKILDKKPAETQAQAITPPLAPVAQVEQDKQKITQAEEAKLKREQTEATRALAEQKAEHQEKTSGMSEAEKQTFTLERILEVSLAGLQETRRLTRVSKDIADNTN